jgi:hypothetical protein
MEQKQEKQNSTDLLLAFLLPGGCNVTVSTTLLHHDVVPHYSNGASTIREAGGLDGTKSQEGESLLPCTPAAMMFCLPPGPMLLEPGDHGLKPLKP